MNDRPSSGLYPDPGYDGLSTTTFAGDSTFVSYETQGQGYDYAAASQNSYASYDTYEGYGTGTYDAGAWNTVPQEGYPQETYLSTVPAQGVPDDTGSWTVQSTDFQSTAAGFGYDQATGQWAMPGYGTTGTDTGAYDATAWNTVPSQEQFAQEQFSQEQFAQEQVPQEQFQQAPHDQQVPHDQQQTQAFSFEYDADAYTETAVFQSLGDEDGEADEDAPVVHDLPTQAMPVTPAADVPAPRASRRAGAKGAQPAAGSRRRSPAKRSALLTVAVPSACVMGVAGVAAASVGGLTGGDKPSEGTTTMAAPDPASVKPVAANNKLDTQLQALSADAGDFADRASRTQERIDLRQRQDEERKRKAEEEAAKEAARPKFALPVSQHGLSAMFGQAGGMWMSVHTGIDFPVGYGTPVMAATDGTVRTQWNSAYGNMAIVTSPDGTETWYCHLSSTKIRSGKVKAGDVIAYSGNSGNSTGPHLHFEVHPGGGSAVDPLAWLRNHGLDPT
ncbi:peptidoglycan DD-metalloendopeptidase family protein [Streptomyces sp. NPDC046866]|uniref:M23 family metallopeptidase n=1 Tax=Streptomyces sp. NPDC046866 TaxID=3154921 RepID=UPI003454A97E